MPLPRPPSADPLVALADQCVQCGLCLPACPTYGRDRLEAESPRGRIALARGWALAALEPTAAGDEHLDHCLGCRSCEAVCPAGVRYGALLTAARARQRQRRGATWRERMIEALARRPRLLAALLAIYRRTYPALPATLRPLPRPPRRRDTTRPPPSTTPTTRAALFLGCVARAYEPAPRDALRRLLAACDIDLVALDGQTCCGALHAHAGASDTAAELAVINARAFGNAPLVLTLASGCHEAVAVALPASTETVDAIEFLARHADCLRFRPGNARIALHLPCTQRNVVRSVPALRRLLARIPHLEIVELNAGFGCCGAAGTAMLTDAERAASFRAPLVAQADAANVREVLSANLGCRLHLANGTALPVRHPIEFLAEHLDGIDAGAQ
ncbi:(Fe-S)-binding protein [Lysobacter sp. TY2-98]|uniref:(Fe-S)-binding protein n=1 Tax=Lysobacter sp. TY2-98 TaxID=2290922 RepID=UPI000E209BB8|nr:(Fe-S)-binding protein [Lysobacter sp. TY2-98]AXK70875.1 (Fe-S)-binding protein [Lysobacter sp. TY2-98]